MRITKSNADLSVKIIAGTDVILFGLNIPKGKKSKLLGFRIKKKNGSTFKELNDGRNLEGSNVSLIQEFLWGDYEAKPGKSFTYKITAVYGTIDSMRDSSPITVTVTTENQDEGQGAVYFNRGVAGSQAYSRKFGKYRKWYKTESQEMDSSKIRFRQFLKPEDIPEKKAFKWLSRGLEEALLAYIAQAKDGTYSIRASLYELSYLPAAQAFVSALERGVDVKIIHHSKPTTEYKMRRNTKAETTINYSDDTATKTYRGRELSKESTPEKIAKTALDTIGEVGISNMRYSKAFREMLIHRTQTSISHNKFIILLKDGQPIEVWTGSTNLTLGGIYGQSNVGQIIRDTTIAESYLNYWTKLSEDPKKKSTARDPELTGMTNWVEANNPNLVGDPAENSVQPIFSPRKDEDMLKWYADRMAKAKESVFFTAAFSMDSKVLSVLKKAKRNIEGDGYLRYLMLETKGGMMKDKYPILKRCDQNRIAYGENLKKRNGTDNVETMRESLTGLNDHVSYVHTKYLLIDALSDDPIVISGSANFSGASTTNNDENMLIFRGNKRVADMYICEFMRLFNHFKRRNDANERSDEDFEKRSTLDNTSKWARPYFDSGTQEYQERILFSK